MKVQQMINRWWFDSWVTAAELETQYLEYIDQVKDTFRHSDELTQLHQRNYKAATKHLYRVLERMVAIGFHTPYRMRS